MRINQTKIEPCQPRFSVGLDHHGRWIVTDRLDRVGGLFTSEHAARHFAFEEADHDMSQITPANNDAPAIADGAQVGRS